MAHFPAILIGGPPHSGKSVLTYNLTHALRERGVQHYVVRAAPDGEGDWANEAAQPLVRVLRTKGDFTPAFTDFCCRSLLARHLPLLVDAGGKPTPEQERIFDCCTHALLLASDESGLAQWRALAARHGLPVIAELTSRLEGKDRITDTGSVLRGVISGLERGHAARGATFDALVHRLAILLHYEPGELYHLHQVLCPVETIIHLDRLALTFGIPFEGQKAIWQPDYLPRVLNYLPEAVPLALYGRGPNWLYVAVTLLAAPAPFVQFDPRLGWVQAAPLSLGSPAAHDPLLLSAQTAGRYVHLKGTLPAAHLDHGQLGTVTAPPVPAHTGVVLDGKLPLWVYTSLALTYRTAPWIAVYQPQLDCAVVAYSAAGVPAMGECLYDIVS
ncbi:MAG: hypothetical protein JXA14_18495 [Anaerolineae bacterium]|nr:hypothetical protein [Anaerolineae bacterium]